MNFEEYDRIIEKMERGEQLEPEEWSEGFSAVDDSVSNYYFIGEDDETGLTKEDDEVFNTIREDMSRRGLIKPKKRAR